MRPRALFVGLATLDVIAQVERLPADDEKLDAGASWLAAGGPAANAAIAFAALGGRARLWTALGHGMAAEAVRADLADAGVEVVDAAPPDFALAASAVLVNRGTGERAVVSGAAHRPELAAQALPDLAGTVVVMLDGHHRELAAAAAAAAGAAGIDVVVDAGSHKAVFDEAMAVVTDLLCSASYRHPDGLGPEALLARGPRLVAVSHGAGPVRWWSGELTGEVAVPPVVSRDTLGAGDVWHGGYCYARALGLPRVGALGFANRVAATRVGLAGPFDWRAALGDLSLTTPELDEG